MSSNKYSASLTPDPWLRIFVLISGRFLIAAGLVLILTLTVDVWMRALACCVWITSGRFEIRRLQRGFAICRRIRIHSDGEIEILNNHEEWQPATLQTGSLLLRRFGWLRIRGANGTVFLELVRGNARQSHNWRRLQVIWRHIGA